MGVGTRQLDFAEFYRSAADECLRTVLVSIGDQDTARELVDEAFARAWASWRTVSRHPAHSADTRLASWTVAKQANGDIDVTINQLENPAGLQSTLRADGLPVNVTFSGAGLSAACQPYATSQDMLRDVAHYNTSDRSLVIDPSALPSGTGVGIFDEPGAGGPVPSPRPGTPEHGQGSGIVAIPVPAGINGPLAVGLVYASQQCTGWLRPRC
jgi:hypothetical protein